MSYFRSLDRIPGDLSYCLHLLIGFDCVEVDPGERVSAMGGMGPLVVVECDPAADACFGLGAGLPSVQIDAFIFQGPPEALDEDVVEAAPLADLPTGPKDAKSTVPTLDEEAIIELMAC